MALDFAVLTEDETSADIVSLGMIEHDVLMTLAEQLGLTQLLRIEDYCEEIDFSFSELPKLAEDLSIVKNSATSRELKEFAKQLDALITIALKRKRQLTAVPD